MPSGGTTGRSLLEFKFSRGGAWMPALAVISAASLGALTVLAPAAPAAVGSALLVGMLLWFTRTTSHPENLRGKRFLWLSVAWALLLLRPIGDFSTGRTALAAAEGDPSIENVVELLTHAAIGLVALASLKRNRLNGIPPAAILVLPAIALLSTTWSLTPMVTLAFSFELWVIVLVGTLTAAIVGTDTDIGRSIVRRTLLLIVAVIAALCVIGLLVGDAGTRASSTAENLDRFTWPGAHPVVASAEIGLAFLIVAFGGRRPLRLSAFSRGVLLALFAGCLYLGQTRTALIALVTTLVIGLLIAADRSVLRRLAGLVGVIVAMGVGFFIFGSAIGQYLLRGESQQQVYGFNGRLALWDLAARQIESPERWLVGHGIGGTRVFFSSQAWAGEAHSAWLELLLSLGLIGIVAGIVLVAVVAVRMKGSPNRSAIERPLLPLLFLYLLLMSPTGSGFGIPGPGPGLGFGLLVLCYAAATAPVRQASAAPLVRRRLDGSGDARVTARTPAVQKPLPT